MSVINTFPAPWLRNRAIDAPHKIDVLDWYSGTIGFHPDVGGSILCPNNALRFLQMHGKVLYMDEFNKAATSDLDKQGAYVASRTWSRINRVFRAVDMIRKFKAAYEDGADLLRSWVDDDGWVWLDSQGQRMGKEKLLGFEMLREEFENRTPSTEPVAVFWRIQESKKLALERTPEHDGSVKNMGNLGGNEDLAADQSSLTPTDGEDIIAHPRAGHNSSNDDVPEAAFRPNQQEDPRTDAKAAIQPTSPTPLDPTTPEFVPRARVQQSPLATYSESCSTPFSSSPTNAYHAWADPFLPSAPPHNESFPMLTSHHLNNRHDEGWTDDDEYWGSGNSNGISNGNDICNGNSNHPIQTPPPKPEQISTEAPSSSSSPSPPSSHKRSSPSNRNRNHKHKPLHALLLKNLNPFLRSTHVLLQHLQRHRRAFPSASPCLSPASSAASAAAAFTRHPNIILGGPATRTRTRHHRRHNLLLRPGDADCDISALDFARACFVPCALGTVENLRAAARIDLRSGPAVKEEVEVGGLRLVEEEEEEEEGMEWEADDDDYDGDDESEGHDALKEDWGPTMAWTAMKC